MYNCKRQAWQIGKKDMWEMFIDFARASPLLAAVALFVASVVCVSFLTNLVFTKRARREFARQSGACLDECGVFYVVFITPVLEELLFRFAPLAAVLLWQEMQITTQTWVVVGVVSFFFGLAHSNLGQIVTGTILGILWSVVFLLYVFAHNSLIAGLVVAVSFHVAWNTLVVLNIYRLRRVERSRPG